MQEIIFSQVCKKQERERRVCVFVCVGRKEREQTVGEREVGIRREGERR